MSLERGRESLVIPGLENPKEIIQLGSAVARRGRVRNTRNLETSTVIGAYGGNKYKVVYENFAAFDSHERLDITGVDMGVTIVSGGLWMTEVFADYYFGDRNIRDVLSGLDPITILPVSADTELNPEESEKPNPARIVAVGSNGFYTRRGSTLFVVAKTIDDARRVYASLLEQHNNNFPALRAAFSNPDRLPFVYMTPERYENMLSPEQIKALTDKMIKELLGYIFPDDDSA